MGKPPSSKILEKVHLMVRVRVRVRIRVRVSVSVTVRARVMVRVKVTPRAFCCEHRGRRAARTAPRTSW